MTGLVVRRNSKGRGVYATRRFACHELVMACPVIVAPMRALLGPVLEFYVFEWGDPATGALALGYGSLVNHAYRPNAVYRSRIRSRELHFFARHSILPGEEVTVNYNGDPEDRTPVEHVKEQRK